MRKKLNELYAKYIRGSLVGCLIADCLIATLAAVVVVLVLV